MPQTGAPSEEQFGKRASEGLEPIKKPKVDLGVTTPSEVQQYNNPKTPHSFVAPPALPDRTLITAERMKETYRQISERTLSHTPDTMFWAAGVKNDPITARITDEVLTHFTTYYGNEDLAAFLSAELLGDEQSTRTIATLKYLRGYETPTQTQPVLRGTVPPQAQTGALPEDVLKQVLADPSAIQNLSTLQQQQVSSMADELLSTIETLPDQGIAGDIKRAIYIGRTGDTSVALTEDEVAAIKTIPSILEGMNIGGTTQEAPDRLKDIGIDQVRQLENGIVVLDRETAQADPAKAYAIEILLQQDYPDLTVKYDRQGALGWVMDKLGVPLDWVAAPIGAGLKQISEIADRVRSPEDRQKFLDIADQMEGFIKNNDAKGYGALRNAGLIPLYNLPGGVDPTREDQNWVEEAQGAIAMFRDWGTEEVGFEDFANQTVRNTRPAVLGLGVSEDLARAADVLPGDREYGPLMVGGMLVTIAFDPFNWAPGLIGGLKAAKYIPKLHAGALDDYFRAVAGDIRELRPELNYEQSLDAARAGFRGAITEDAIYPLVGRGVWKDSVYRRFARFKEDPRMQATNLKASERLFQIKKVIMEATKGSAQVKKAAGEDRLFTAIAKLSGDGVLPGGDTLLARDLARANSVEDMQAIQMKAVLGLDEAPLNMDQYIQERSAVTAELNRRAITGGPIDDLVARREWLDDVIKGRDYVRPLEQLMTAKQVRQIARAANAPLNPIQNGIMHVIDMTERFPGNILSIPRREGREYMIAIENMHKETGAGEVIIMPWQAKRAPGLRVPTRGIIENAAEDSFSHLYNQARIFGLRKDRINELMAGWKDLHNAGPSASYDWLKNFWETMIDESPRLNSLGRRELKRMHKTFSSDWAPGYITKVVDGETIHTPTIYRTATDVSGNPIKLGKPVFSSDMLSSWRTPDIALERSYLTALQGEMRKWEQAGKVRKTIATAHSGLSQFWSDFNNIWRSVVLGFRPVALPARIFNEQMLRIAGFGYDSAVWHPLEWFLSTKAGLRWNADDFIRNVDVPTFSLGSAVKELESHPGFAMLKAGRESVSQADGAMFYRATAADLNRMYAAPELHTAYLPHLDEPETILANLERTDAGRDFLSYYRSINMDPLEAVTNTAEEIKQAIGTGPGAAKVRELLRGGKVEIDGEIFRVGTSDLAKKLQKLADRGDWVPGKSFLNRSAGDYLPIERSKFAPIKDTWFKWIYSNPDLAASRSPLFRQMAARKYKNLVAHGYDKTRAENLAIAYGARGTSDYMFTIGAKTSGEYFLKNLNPFFPAYRELATTWLKRLPLAVGEGHWALGAAAIARRANIWFHVFENLGILQKDEQGNLVIPLPGFGTLVSALTGRGDYSVTASLDSLAGILPLPSHLFDTDEQGNPLPWSDRLKGMVPTFGGPATFILGELKEVPGLKDALSEIEDWVTLYGTDSSLGPLAVDRFVEAWGSQMPWMTNTTKDFHEILRTFAVIDGQNLAREEMGPPPNQDTDPKGYKKYVEELMAKGEHYATVTYIIKGAASMLLPFSVDITDENKKRMSAMWGLINALPHDESGFKSAVIDSFLTDYPSYQPYMTGKTLDLRPVDHPGEGIDAYFQAIKDGDVVVPNPLQHIIFSLGMQSYSLYQSKVAATFDSDATVAEQLLDFDARETRKQLRDDWDFFLDQSEVNLLPGQTQSFADMYKTYNHYKDMRDGIKTPRLSQEQQKILAISDLEDTIAEYQVDGSRFSEKYYDAIDKAYAILDYEPTSEFGKAQQWYFDEYQRKYHDRVDRLYDEAHRLEMHDEDAGKVYDEIRAVSDSYNHPVVNPSYPEWGKFPSPEEYSFTKLDEKDQELQVTQWADRPTEWLTAFQRSQVFPNLPENKQDEAGRLSDLVTRGTRKLDAAVEKSGLDDQSTEVQNAEAALAGLYKARAKEMGIQDYWAAANAPLYQRLDSALGLSDRTQSWGLAEKWAKEITKAIQATPYADDKPPYTQFYSERGDSEPAVAGRQLLIDRVAQWRKNDEEFDKVMGGLQVSLGEEGKPLSEGEVVEKVFFNVVQISFG